MTFFSSELPVLPSELQSVQSKLLNIRQPSVPYKRDTVGDSESALDGDSLSETAGALFLAAIMPWWADIFIDGGSGPDRDEWKDYVLVTGGTAVGVTWYLAANTDLGWFSFTWGMMASVLALFLMVIFHLTVHKCITMYVYNRLCRPGWMEKMRAADEARYQEEVSTYSARLAKYESDIESAIKEANDTLNVYNASIASNPRQKGFVLEGHYFQKAKSDDLIKDFTDGAKEFAKEFADFTKGKSPQDLMKNSTSGAKSLIKGIFK